MKSQNLTYLRSIFRWTWWPLPLTAETVSVQSTQTKTFIVNNFLK